MGLKIILLGAPGAGKGTQAELLVNDLGLVHLSTGNLLREAVEAQTQLGKEAASYMEAGKLVPDQVIIGLVEEFLQKVGPSGCLLDGFPRTLAQAEALDEIFKKLDMKLDYVIEVRTTPEVIVQRLAHRLVCRSCGAPYHALSKPPAKAGVCDSCGGAVVRRADDEPETIKKRLREYQEKTAPLIDYYQQKGLLITVNGDLSREATYEEIKAKLGVTGK